MFLLFITQKKIQPDIFGILRHFGISTIIQNKGQCFHQSVAAQHVFVLTGVEEVICVKFWFSLSVCLFSLLV